VSTVCAVEVFFLFISCALRQLDLYNTGTKGNIHLLLDASEVVNGHYYEIERRLITNDAWTNCTYTNISLWEVERCEVTD
jgi:hypothetical protein